MKDIRQILSEMTLEEKIALCSGADFWHTKTMQKYGIPGMTLSDGPNGLRIQKVEGVTDMLGVHDSLPATCFPSSCLTASSFDPSVTESIGRAIGEEAAAMDVDVVLGPGANIKRNPLCGRNFEYFSEDPYLSGKMAAGWIKGVESTGTATSLKHFACNSQERSRFNSDSIMDERTLREIYLAGYEIAVKEGRPSTVMSAYNKINGNHCSDSPELLNGILRREWGFDGMVVTDWGGLNDRIEAFRAGCDLSMPGGSGYMEKKAAKAVRSGRLDENLVDLSAERILTQIFRSHSAGRPGAPYDADEHSEIARKAAEESAVLLKNDGKTLPLNMEEKIVLIGAMAKRMRYQGAGSSHINPTKLISPCDAMPELEWSEGCFDDGSTSDELIDQAVSAAKTADVAVVFAGLPDRYESEGFDRDDMKMPAGQIRLINEVSSANPDTVVVLFCGSPVECPWTDSVRAILYMGLPGQSGGEAVKNILFGKVCPSGRLAESWPVRYEDCASSDIFSKERDALYEEGIYVGYRYYDKAGTELRFRFGDGLSYTEFEYSDLTVDNGTASVTVSNNGDMEGSDAVLLWISPPGNGIHRPVRELRGFEKIRLRPGEKRTVVFDLSGRSFAVWQDGWKVPEGTYTVSVGDLSRSVEINGEAVDIPSYQEESWYDRCMGKPGISDLEKALGKAVIISEPRKGSYTMDNSIMEMKKTSVIMKIMFYAVETTVAKGAGGKKDYSDPGFKMMIYSSAGAPVRSMQISGGIRGGLFEGLTEMANGHFFRGMGKIIGL